MRVGSGPAVGGSLGSVHKKCSSSATLMKIDNPRRKLVVEQFVTTSPGNVTIATTAIAIVLSKSLPTTLTQASWHTVNKKVFTHTWKERKFCRQWLAMAANGRSNMVEEELLPAAGWHDHQGLVNEQFTDEQPPAVASCQ